jgi:pyruvate/2-oxoglutarate dehydrogenase complex dihydrolipoamide acyltransferase (E2) component
MNVAISFDHNVSDGAVGTQFMQALARFLDNPVRL